MSFVYKHIAFILFVGYSLSTNCSSENALPAFGNQPASALITQLAQKAQNAVGIQKKDYAQVKKLPDYPAFDHMAACVYRNTMYVNEKRCADLTQGALYATLCHESIHLKYNDSITSNYVMLLSGGLGALTTYLGLKKVGLGNIQWLAVPVAICASALVAQKKYGRFIEARADQEGLRATQCATCVTEIQKRRQQIFAVDKNPLRNNGYLWPKDIQPIITELRGTYCSYHAKK